MKLISSSFHDNFGSNVFYGCDKDKLTLYVYEGSKALKYAEDYHFKYETSVYDPTVEYLYGDVDDDGKITSADSLSVLRASVSLETFDKIQKTIADVDGNDKLDSADSLAVLRYSVGLDTPGCRTGTIMK